MLIDVNLTEAPLLVPAVPKEMLGISKLSDGRTLVRINSSSLDVIQNCMRKAQYLLHEGWKPEVESPALTFGSAIHAALEVFYQGEMDHRRVPDIEELERIVCGHAYDERDLVLAATGAFAKKAEVLSSLPDGDKRHPMNGAWLLQHYFRLYINDPYVCYFDDKGPFVERRLEFTLFDGPDLVIEYFGTVDMIGQHVDTKELLAFDHKTTSTIAGYGESGSYFEKDRPNSQYCGYILAAQKNGIAVDSLAVNIVEVKAKPKTSRGSPPSFPRQITTRNTGDFMEFSDAVVDSVRRYLAAADSGRWVIGPVGACNAFSGCTYKQVCASPASVRENILKSKFKKEGSNAPV